MFPGAQTETALRHENKSEPFTPCPAGPGGKTVFNEAQEREDDLASGARRKLGIPEYDPNASLISTLPKILLL